ncbi:polysaccharide export protein EpsE [Chitinibacteraceae bacterium HSL-7]
MRKWFAVVWLLMASTLWADSTPAEYKLGSGDVLRVTVYDHPDLTTEVQVGGDGSIGFPLVGTLNVGGKTSNQAEKSIASALKSGGYIVRPNVNVLVTQYRARRVAVLGEVNQPGRYALDNEANLFDVLAMAGGINASGGDEIQIKRGDGVHQYRLSELVTAGQSNPLMVDGGDVVYVPRMQVFYVYGEVNRPGNFRLEPNMTVMQAISVAGGFNPRASKRSILVHRTQADGTVQEVEVKPTDKVADNDTIFVEESLF